MRRRASRFATILVIAAAFLAVACGDDDDERTDAGDDAGERDARVRDGADNDATRSDAGQCMEAPNPSAIGLYANTFSVVQLNTIAPFIQAQMRDVPHPTPRARIGSCVQYSNNGLTEGWASAPDRNYGDVRLGTNDQFILYVVEPRGAEMDILRTESPTYIPNASSYAGFDPDDVVTIEFLGESTSEVDGGIAYADGGAERTDGGADLDGGIQRLDGGITTATAALVFPPDVATDEIVIPSSWPLGEPLVIELDLPEDTPRDAFVYLYGGGRGYGDMSPDGGVEDIFFVSCVVSVCDSTLEIPAEFRADFEGVSVRTRPFLVGLGRSTEIEGAPLDAKLTLVNALFTIVTLTE